MRSHLEWAPAPHETVAGFIALLIALAAALLTYERFGSWALAIVVIAVVSYALGRALRPRFRKEDCHGHVARG